MTKRLDPEVKAANKIIFGKIRSERMTGSGNHFFGKHHSAESNKKIASTKIGKPSPRLGARLDESTKEKIRLSQTGVAEVKRDILVQPACGKYKLVSLTRGHVAFVDSEDYDRVCSFLWISYVGKNTSYAQRALPKENNIQKGEKMHHVILGIPPNGMMIDHINGNGLDNRKHNLRVVTNRQNCMNRHKSHSSKYPGVSQNKRSGNWIAQAQINGKHVHIGSYPTEELAYIAYCEVVNPIEQKKIEEVLL